MPIKKTIKKPKKETKPKSPKAEVEPKEPEKIEEAEERAAKLKKYYEAVGRRKTAVARVRLFTIKPFEGEEGKITVNEKPYKEYFTLLELQQTAEASLRKLKSLNRFEVVAQGQRRRYESPIRSPEARRCARLGQI